MQTGKIFNSVIFFFLFLNTFCLSQQTATTSDGKTVILNNDGTWKYLITIDSTKTNENQNEILKQQKDEYTRMIMKQLRQINESVTDKEVVGYDDYKGRLDDYFLMDLTFFSKYYKIVDSINEFIINKEDKLNYGFLVGDIKKNTDEIYDLYKTAEYIWKQGGSNRTIEMWVTRYSELKEFFSEINVRLDENEYDLNFILTTIFNIARLKIQQMEMKSVNYNSALFTIQYPENYNITYPEKGKMDFVMQLNGERLDCSVRLDIFDVGRYNLDEVFEWNKKSYEKNYSKISIGKASIDTLTTLYINYSAREDVDSRAYFIIKNNKAFRITLNWYIPQQKVYISLFEEVVNSFRLK
jgi:hypothetical protein